MLFFECDYNNGCHPEILKKLEETNFSFQPGYGDDEFSSKAKSCIRKACNCPDADIYFISGGTQTNEVVISSLLKPWQGVISAVTGHIQGHEAGAIENTGHKVLTVDQKEGKITALSVEKLVKGFYKDANHEHMVFPGMVYISFPTEYGTIYKKKELQELYSVCREYKMPLFIDGARLGYGLASYDCDLTLEDIARNCDVFYIGGTKVGALCGEAVVFPRANAPEHFFTMVKQRGALLAKGRLCGVQFQTLFENDLYFKISRNAIEKAEKLKEVLKKKNFTFFLETSTNQQFVIIENSKMDELSKHVRFGFWECLDENHSVIRFATSWATRDEDINALEEVL